MTFTTASLTAASLLGLLAFAVVLAATVAVAVGDLLGRDVVDGLRFDASDRPEAAAIPVRAER